MFWLTFISILLVVLIWLFFFSKPKPIYYRNMTFNDLNNFFTNLFDMLANKSILIIEHQESPKFIQFVKHTEKGAKYLSFSFPSSPWSKNYFVKLESALNIKNVPFTIVNTDNDTTTKFIDINYIDKTSLALEIAKIALVAMDLDIEDKYVIHYEGYQDFASTKKYINKALSQTNKQQKG